MAEIDPSITQNVALRSSELDLLWSQLRSEGGDVIKQYRQALSNNWVSRHDQIKFERIGNKVSFIVPRDNLVDLSSLTIEYDCTIARDDGYGINTTSSNASIFDPIAAPTTYTSTGDIYDVPSGSGQFSEKQFLSQHQIINQKNIYGVIPIFVCRSIEVKQGGSEVCRWPLSEQAPLEFDRFMTFNSLLFGLGGDACAWSFYENTGVFTENSDVNIWRNKWITPSILTYQLDSTSTLVSDNTYRLKIPLGQLLVNGQFAPGRYISSAQPLTIVLETLDDAILPEKMLFKNPLAKGQSEGATSISISTSKVWYMNIQRCTDLNTQRFQTVRELQALAQPIVWKRHRCEITRHATPADRTGAITHAKPNVLGVVRGVIQYLQKVIPDSNTFANQFSDPFIFHFVPLKGECRYEFSLGNYKYSSQNFDFHTSKGYNTESFHRDMKDVAEFNQGVAGQFTQRKFRSQWPAVFVRLDSASLSTVLRSVSENVTNSNIPEGGNFTMTITHNKPTSDTYGTQVYSHLGIIIDYAVAFTSQGIWRHAHVSELPLYREGALVSESRIGNITRMVLAETGGAV